MVKWWAGDWPATADESQEESPLDDLIRQLQHQQDDRLNSGNPTGEKQPTVNLLKCFIEISMMCWSIVFLWYNYYTLKGQNADGIYIFSLYYIKMICI